MSQGKLNAIPPGVGGVAGQLATSQTTNQIAQQGQASAQPTPPIGTMPGTFGRPGQSVQQPQIGQFDSIGAAAPVAMPGGQIQTMENKYPGGIPGLNPAGGGIKQFGGHDMFAVLTPDMMARYNAGVNTPAPEDELNGLGGPDSQGQGY